ncbi:hypothetical protein R0137_03710 [Congregibacter brevis]|uniref:Nuclear transport factor 2 family protein n=1 Tax=Congregibacter brevis TaxID=3081201 RepID=A0ABZ0IF38_9GAMM|nr:hypothetical protein R0137_03710 [Congregibacter sp. IMCC45268]
MIPLTSRGCWDTATAARFRRSSCERYASLRSIATAIFLLYVGPMFAGESPAERVSAYLVAFNGGLDMEEVSAEYWLSEMVLNPGEQPPIHLSRSALAQQFQRLRLGLREAGWVRSEVGETLQCKLRKDFALVSVSYSRVFEDGTRRPGAALYTLGKDSSVWKISSINVIDEVQRFACSDEDA